MVLGPSFEEDLAEIRAVDRHVADGACLILRRLIMEIRCPRSVAEGGARMALQAEDIEVAGLEQVRIGRAMRRMACFAAFCLDRLVLEDEGSLLVGVAREADSIPRRRRPKLLPDEPSMGVMAVRALNKSFLDPVVEGHVELRLHLKVAGVAELRLCFHQQEVIRGGVVG